MISIAETIVDYNISFIDESSTLYYFFLLLLHFCKGAFSYI